MRTASGWELPPDKAALMRRAVRLEWLSVAYLISAVFFIYLTLGSSQAMKTAWFEDILSLIPAIMFLVASRVRHRPPNDRYPYGYHRAVTVAFLCAALALFLMGVFLLYDAVTALLAFEHPTIGTVVVLGRQVWLGWLMIPALLWSAIPALILGRIKLPLARRLHDKVLYADAKMNKADWLTAGAATVGVLGIGIGWWWADAVAAALISTDILHDGFVNVRAVAADLLSSRPTTVDHAAVEGLPERIRNQLLALHWVVDADVRMREEGHVFFGEAFVLARDDRDLTAKINRAASDLLGQDWRLQDLVIMPVTSGAEDGGEHRHTKAQP
ncbi:MAG: cation transporter [Nitriliruptorales bacterium]|nr:cation transporter [Nitriliruptorales bacterium]